MKDLLERVLEQIRPVVVGQDETVELTLIALRLPRSRAAGGRARGRQDAARTCAGGDARGARCAACSSPPTCCPPTSPGTMTLRGQELVFRPGPVFTNLLLADEINRTPPKTQAALLEAMQEGQVTIDGEAHPLRAPFLVLATQNPIEYEGTYPLPEAQLDRFLLKVQRRLPERRAGTGDAGARSRRGGCRLALRGYAAGRDAAAS